MARPTGLTRGLGAAALATAFVAVAAAVGYGIWGGRSDPAVAAASGEVTGSLAAPTRKGDSGLALPRFVSLKADRVNVRRGPSSEHQVSWVFTRKGLPVEIIAEYEHWRRIRDAEGAEGWVYHSLLSGRRRIVVAPWNAGRTVPLRQSAGPDSAAVALVAAGVMGDVDSCTGTWCRVAIDGYSGWIEQALLWGVYPGERIDN